jgi:hypothetical protein
MSNMQVLYQLACRREFSPETLELFERGVRALEAFRALWQERHMQSHAWPKMTDERFATER